MTGKDKIDREQFFQLADSNYGLRGYSLKIRKDRPNLDISFFSQRVLNVWNKLLQHVRQLIQEQAGQPLGRYGRYKLHCLRSPWSYKYKYKYNCERPVKD